MFEPAITRTVVQCSNSNSNRSSYRKRYIYTICFSLNHQWYDLGYNCPKLLVAGDGYFLELHILQKLCRITAGPHNNHLTLFDQLPGWSSVLCQPQNQVQHCMHVLEDRVPELVPCLPGIPGYQLDHLHVLLDHDRV